MSRTNKRSVVNQVPATEDKEFKTVQQEVSTEEVTELHLDPELQNQDQDQNQEHEFDMTKVEEPAAVDPHNCRGADGKLIPIAQVVIPDLQTTSARIRWLSAQGYAKGDIARKLNKLYQHVFNVLSKELKQGAREAVPGTNIPVQASQPSNTVEVPASQRPDERTGADLKAELEKFGILPRDGEPTEEEGEV